MNFKKNPFPIIKEADLFVLTSKYEGLPNVLLEAQTLKKFIISTNCPTGPSEILKNGKCGSLVKVGDYKSLNKEIQKFIKKKVKSKKMINHGYESLIRFDKKSNLNKYFNLVNNFLK